jgi:hypothetical protein
VSKFEIIDERADIEHVSLGLARSDLPGNQGLHIMAMRRVVLLTPARRATADALPGKRSRHTAERQERSEIKATRPCRRH